MKTIMIDSGHGGRDPGAISEHGMTEASVTLDVAFRLKEALREGLPPSYIVGMTHLGSGAGLRDRADHANRLDRTVAFVSLHCNAAHSRMARGIEIFTSPGNTGADSLATHILDSIKGGLPAWPGWPGTKYREDWSDGDPDKEARFTVLTATRMPAVLIEMGFISNEDDALALKSTLFRQRMAESIAQGIVRWLQEEAR
jgi:N-acetylmuramoyl-L-alanine amidase